MRLFDPGLGREYAHNTKRIINKDGTFNVRRIGVRRQRYQSLLRMSNLRFILVISLAYLFFNMLFMSAYLIVGTDTISVTNKNIVLLHIVYHGLYWPPGFKKNKVGM